MSAVGYRYRVAMASIRIPALVLLVLLLAAMSLLIAILLLAFFEPNLWLLM